MNWKRSTLLGMDASWAFVKWNSEFARVLRAATVTGIGLTFTALLLRDRAGTFKIVEREDVLQLGVCIDDRPAAVLFSLLNLIDQERVDVVGLLVAEQSGKVLI